MAAISSAISDHERQREYMRPIDRFFFIHMRRSVCFYSIRRSLTKLVTNDFLMSHVMDEGEDR